MSAMARAMVAEARFSTGSMALRKMSSMELLLAGLGMRFSLEADCTNCLMFPALSARLLSKLRRAHNFFFWYVRDVHRALWRNGKRARLKIEWGNPPSRFESGEGQTKHCRAAGRRVFSCGGARPPCICPGLTTW